MKSTLLLLGCLLAGCQTSAEHKSPTAKSSQKTRTAKESPKAKELNEKNALSGEWDKGLLDYGAQERSRQALDLH